MKSKSRGAKRQQARRDEATDGAGPLLPTTTEKIVRGHLAAKGWTPDAIERIVNQTSDQIIAEEFTRAMQEETRQTQARRLATSEDRERFGYDMAKPRFEDSIDGRNAKRQIDEAMTDKLGRIRAAERDGAIYGNVGKAMAEDWRRVEAERTKSAMLGPLHPSQTTQEVHRRGHVDQAVDGVSGALNVAYSLMETLAARLGSVLRPTEPAAPTTAASDFRPTPPSSTPLVGLLNEESNKARSLVSMLRDVLDRLEV